MNVRCNHFESAWRDARVLVSWQLLVIDAPVTFAISRRSGGGSYAPMDFGVTTDGRGEFHYEDTTTRAGARYTYRVVVVQNGAAVTSFETAVSVPFEGLSLGPARPSPFNPSTEIPFTLDQPGYAKLAVYDVRGALIRTLLARSMPAGPHVVTWDGRAVLLK